MKEYDVIIIGGGPAGSSCAWRLIRDGIRVLILEKAAFPRVKLCAGWVTPYVFRLLAIKPSDYPYGLLTFKRLHFRFKGRPFPLPTRQYSVRRYEFDRFLLERSSAPVIRHRAEKIEQTLNGFVVDGKYSARYLIGAGGTHCPVYRSLFKKETPREEAKRIVTIEEEFAYEYRDANCYLWFFENDLPGYAWYVPKANGYLNVGIGGGLMALKKKGQTIHEHWQRFTEKLDKLNLVRGYPFASRGYTYYLRAKKQTVFRNNAFLVGDAAGLATLDMGEGISAAIQSGLLAAQAIIRGKPESYYINRIARLSLFRLFVPY